MKHHHHRSGAAGNLPAVPTPAQLPSDLRPSDTRCLRRHFRLAGRGLLALALGIALALAALPGPVGAQSSSLTLSLCRTAVQPCQREVNLLPGQIVALDLLLADAGANPLPVVAWETHLKLSNGLAVEVVAAEGSVDLVQEQGDPLLALHGLDKLAGPANEASSQYFTVQNRYRVELGQLDYTVTLLRFDPTRPGLRVTPMSNRSGLALGRIIIRGLAPGTVELTPGGPQVPFRVATLAPSGELSSPGAIGFASPLARINVDTVQVPVSLRGQLELPAPSRPDALTRGVLAVSFWEPGAAPPWRAGAAFPVAVFSGISIDLRGGFQVTDIVPAVLAPGTYDTRIKVSSALTQQATGFVLPLPGGSPSLPLSFGPPRYGDVNGDDVVDAADLLDLQGSFGRRSTDPVYRALADFNADRVVDGQDFSVLALSFQQRGE